MPDILKNSIFFIFRTITLLFAVSVIAFVLVEASPVDPVNAYLNGSAVSEEQRQQIEEYWGVNDPPVERYVNWLSSLLHGDMGISLIYRRPVFDVIMERFVNSLALMATAWILAGIVGFLLGCVMGMNRDRAADLVLKRVCYVLSSMPTFWIGLLLLILFAVVLQWFPIGFSVPIDVLKSEATLGQRLYHLILPAITLSLVSFPNVAIQTREKLITVMESDYVLFARARGESRHTILFRHGIRNIILPALTLQFASFAELFGGAVLAENVFSYPGLGSAVTAAGLSSDVPLLLGITLFSALFVSVGNMIANLLYGVVDPRIREGSR